MDKLAIAIEAITTLLALCGLSYSLLALWSARDFVHRRRGNAAAQPVSILKPVKGVDTRMYAGFVSHCTQQYAGEYEILFGVSDRADPSVAMIQQLQAEYPSVAIRLIECGQRLGTSGKVSNLVQMLPYARYSHYIVNDSDILVSPQYLAHVMAEFGERVGMVTVPYIGRAGSQASERTVWSKLEALGIATDFFAGVLTARKIEGGIHFGLGSTLAFTREALDTIGGLDPLLEYLADDYELGVRIARAGYTVVLANEVVETAVPKYGLRGFWDHQMRWMRSTRDSRKAGYAGLVFTYALPWAILNCVASGFTLESFSLLSLVCVARVAVALTVGVGVLRDEQVLRDIWLLPVRDFVSLLLWAWSYANNIVVWRGEKFRLKDGRISRA
ncbi:MAG TPA: bacteriohopanetetrol glucosamine biosynthesis glycosyltransferase HpnI [Acidobacteriaceae bacterium]|nr:bacteriohopanetetrol glucosamine biosynthesis glycosyltransferase HpnI [Acidobacteriaceae bacterium]